MIPLSDWIDAAVGPAAGRRVLVCGGRRYDQRAAVDAALDRLAAARGVAAIIHGGAGEVDPETGEAVSGADLFAAAWAASRGVVAVMVRAEPEEMLAASRPDGVTAFPGCRGTASIIRTADGASVPVWRPYGEA